jgi:hypothetical protein
VIAILPFSVIAMTGFGERRQTASDPRHADALRALAREVQRLEAELSLQSASFRAHEAPLTIESVQAALPINTTLVEFVRYQHFDPRNQKQQWREAPYIAYILQREGPPRWVALGEAEPSEAAVTAALSALARPGSDARELLRALDELAFAPIGDDVGGVGDTGPPGPRRSSVRVPGVAAVGHVDPAAEQRQAAALVPQRRGKRGRRPFQRGRDVDRPARTRGAPPPANTTAPVSPSLCGNRVVR